MKFAGYRTLSTVDYPGKIVATIFVAGCNFYCEYCHNHSFINLTNDEALLTEEEIFKHLEKRKNILDGICISGGEPLLQEELLEFIKRVKSRFPNFLIKVDSNASCWEMGGEILPYIDFIAIDFKGFPYRYYTRQEIDIITWIERLNQQGIDYEIRLTLYPKYFPKEDFSKVATVLSKAKRVAIQQYDPQNARVKKLPYSQEIIRKLFRKLEKTGILEVVDRTC